MASYVRFYDDSEIDSASQKNRVENLYNYRKNQQSFLYSHGFTPLTDFKKFLTLKALDSSSVDVIPTENPPSASESSSLVDSDIANDITNAIEAMEAEQFVQLYLDKYMAPVGSDIIYRLGDVTGVKAFAHNPYDANKVVYDDNVSYAQYDEFGRLDTAVNLRMKVDIPGAGGVPRYEWRRTPYRYLRKYKVWKFFRFQWVYRYETSYVWSQVYVGSNYVIPPTTEYYTNWFFPPFRKDVFADGATVEDLKIDLAIRRRQWDSVEQKWVYPTGLRDVESATFDTERLLSMRMNPTYRSAAFKAVNDNINFLQTMFEQTCGIVSTYMTEWDLSLYMQEGMMEETNGKTPALVTLLHRIMKDNPSGYTDSKALVYGALNSAVSKTPYGGFKSNRTLWTPYDYPLSTYWWPYDSKDRGDGLDQFYNTAQMSYNQRNFEGRSFRDKVKLYDELGAAYSGWYNWDDMFYWKLLYTSDDDGLSDIDILQEMVDMDDLDFADVGETKGIIRQIIDSLYSNDDSLGFAQEEWDETRRIDENQYFKYHYRRNKYNGNAELMYLTKYLYRDPSYSQVCNPDGTPNPSADSNFSVDESNIRILGVSIPGSSLLKLFLKRNSIKDRAMRLADKTKGKYTTATNMSSSGAAGVITSMVTPIKRVETGEEDVNGGTKSKNSYLPEPKAENSAYARQDGVSQWAPSIYGGPHGRYYSPKTVQGYFEVDNKFLRNVPRLGNLLSVDFKSNTVYNKYEGSYSYYSATDNNRITDSISDRSPGRGVSLLENGFMDYTVQKVYARVKTYYTLDEPTTYYKGNYFYLTHIGRRWHSYSYVESNNNYYYGYQNFWWNGWGNEITRYSCNHSGSYYNGYNYSSNDYSHYTYTLRSRGWTIDTWYEYTMYTGNPVRFYRTLDSITYRSSYNNYYRYPEYRYRMSVDILKHYYYGYVYEWRYVDFKRPLMHSNTSVLWNINQGYTRSYTIKNRHYWYTPHRWWWSWWGWWGHWTRLATYQVVEAGPKEFHWRLTFPTSGITNYRYFENDGYPTPEIRHREEQNFMDRICGNTKGVSDWHKVFMFLSKGGYSERFSKGPDMIFQANVRTNKYSFTYDEWRLRYHWHWFHRDWYYQKETAVSEAYYIEIDMDSKTGTFPVLSGIQGTPWSNLTTLMYSGNRQEMNLDVPTNNYSVNVPSSPQAFSESVSASPNKYVQIWAGYRDNGTENGLHGWGYTSALPGFSERFSYEKTIFEDGNQYLCLTRYNSRNTPISQLTLPFWSLSGYYSPYAYRWSGDVLLSLRGVNSYRREYPDRALIETLRRIYTTSTFYKMNETSTNSYLTPILVSNDSQTRTLARIAIHQKAWIEKAKDVFINSVEFKEIKTIIEKAVDKNILGHTFPKILDTGEKSELYKKDSCLYHPWIAKAYETYGNTSADAKNEIISAFNLKIAHLNNYLNSVNHLISKTAYNWSINDFDTAINAANNLRNNFLNSSEVMEEYIYSYLNVLYEYRKYFINKRCNKVDGTYWILRELEGAIPIVSNRIDKPSEYLAPKGKVIGSNTSGIHQYSVSSYMLNNSVYDKFGALVDETKSLGKDRVMKLYIKVNYVEVETATNYLNLVKEGLTDSETQRYIYIPENDKYAELPFDDVYQYLSNEYTTNEAIKIYNQKVDASSKKEEMDIDDCIFNIIWAEKSNYYANNQLSRMGQRKKYPYVYDSTKSTPKIKFDVVTGIDPAKVMQIDPNLVGTADAFDMICSISKKTDYWVVTIPFNAMPRRSGYLTKLKIKSYREDYNSSEVYFNYPASVAGAFGYMLYPITEEQANTIPGIGLDLTTLATNLADTYTSDITRNIEYESKDADVTKYGAAT